MSLYGDLPPTAQGSDAAVSSQGGWALPPHYSLDSSKPLGRAELPIDGHSMTSRESAAEKSTSFNPKPKTQFAFKPRQTTTAPINRSFGMSIKPKAPAKSVEIRADISSAVYSTDVVEDSGVSYNFECDDEYNPRRPNDYITWCDERTAAKRLERLEEENKLLFEEQQLMRQRREAEKLAAAERGDMEVLESLMSQGKGRGRGVSNLPSWLMKGSVRGDDEIDLSSSLKE